MTSAPLDAELAPRRHVRQRRAAVRRRRRVLTVIGIIAGVLLLLGAAATWILVRGLAAQEALESAKSELQALRTQVVQFDFTSIDSRWTGIVANTADAAALTSDPIWRAGEIIPVLGNELRAVRETAAVVDETVRLVAEPLVAFAKDVDPASLAPKDATIDLALFDAAIPAVHEANSHLGAVLARAEAIPESGIGQISAGVTQVRDLLSELEGPLAAADRTLPLVSPALGGDGVRTYVVMFLNNAELRSLGGSALSFAVIRFDEGKLELVETVPAGYGNFAATANSILPVPQGVAEIYPDGVYGTFIPNITVRPYFPDVAELAQAMWIRDRGYAVDGFIATDTVALSYLLSATDPVSLSNGMVLSDDNLVSFMLNAVYLEQDPVTQDLLYAEASAATFTALTAGSPNPAALFSAIVRGAEEARWHVWSAHPSEQELIVEAGWEGDLPGTVDGVDTVGIYLQDKVGSKLNYYLTQSVTGESGVCPADGARYRVSTALTSTLAPEQVGGLSDSITGTWEREKIAKGVQRLIVFVYAPPGAAIDSVAVDGAPAILEPLMDGDRPVARVIVEVQPGETVTVTAEITPAASGNELRLATTPLAQPSTTALVARSCA